MALSKQATCLSFKLITTPRNVYYIFEAQTAEPYLVGPEHTCEPTLIQFPQARQFTIFKNIFFKPVIWVSQTQTLSTSNYPAGQPDAHYGRRKLTHSIWSLEVVKLALLCQVDRASLARRLPLHVLESFWVWTSQKGLKILETTKTYQQDIWALGLSPSGQPWEG